ncbi:antiviral reverse transcriptase Drt3b [Proteiniphilum acetatigenes]|uniref:antiviral reverse transcriptase Drt3b n=1 Tax=Proteiniphilum acetatigenes TaxID=294710 RepID=UPI000377515E|nr:antiviral reverse transcriptase Drt3b [Proteiniphilum acetatigenes]
MKRKKIELKYKKERVIFSDVLPYETPLIFSNRHFYRFLIKYKIKTADNNLYWDKNMPDEAFESLKLLLGISANKTDGSLNIEKQKIRVPFSYRIAHKQGKFRELTIIHPLNQLQMVEFYEKYKYLILHHCSLSNFSIRHPDKVACYFYYKDRLHEQLLGRKVDSKEEYMNEYENLKSYFSYQKYSNIYKFYEDYRYQRAEKKFDKLLKFDIQDCFNSIYTHSILWATLGGIEQGKNAWNNKQYEDTFGNEFDDLMQKMNFGETNGIVIGPEFSRIFAEIILQRVDKDVEDYMISQEKYLNKDYECYRYVDDYFLFYNDEATKNHILEQFTLRLRQYKLTISDAKTTLFEKPFITDITLAKQKIDNLFSENLKIKIQNEIISEDSDEEEKDIINVEEKDENNFKIEKLRELLSEKRSLYISPNLFNTKYKVIIKESGVEYKNLINYSLAKICSKLETLLKKFDSRFKYLSYFAKHSDNLSSEERDKCIKLRKQDEKMLTNFIVNILDIVFFLYSNNKRINTTLKVLSILNVVILYLKNNYQLKKEKVIRFDKSNIEIVFKKIQDEINLVMQTTPFNQNSQLEAFYLLLALKEMGNGYAISDDTINKYLCVKKDLRERDIKEYTFWNMLLISVLLYYYSDNMEYVESLNFLKKVILKKIKDVDKQQRDISTELILLKMDILSCPHLDNTFKKKVLAQFGVEDNLKQGEIIEYAMKQKSWFIKWKGFNLNYEINAKVSQEVYS